MDTNPLLRGSMLVRRNPYQKSYAHSPMDHPSSNPLLDQPSVESKSNPHFSLLGRLLRSAFGLGTGLGLGLAESSTS